MGGGNKREKKKSADTTGAGQTGICMTVSTSTQPKKTTPTKHRKTQGPAGTAGQSAHRGHNSTKGREPDETGTHWRGRPAPGRDQRALVVRKRPQSPSCRIQVVMPKSPARKERCEAKWQPSRQRAPRPSPGGAGDALHLGDKRPTFNFFFLCP